MPSGLQLQARGSTLNSRPENAQFGAAPFRSLAGHGEHTTTITSWELICYGQCELGPTRAEASEFLAKYICVVAKALHVLYRPQNFLSARTGTAHRSTASTVAVNIDDGYSSSTLVSAATYLRLAVSASQVLLTYSLT